MGAAPAKAAAPAAPAEGTPLVGAADEKQRLAALIPVPMLVVVVLLLIVSVVLNAIVLLPTTAFVVLATKPSVTTTNGTSIEGPWGIFHTIDVLEEYDMWPLVVLVYAFSILWPFAKIVWTAILLAVPTTAASRGWQIRALSHAGRSSLLDILVILLLILVATWEPAKRQLVDIVVAPQPGIFFFPIAILCSMAAVATLEFWCDPVKCQPSDGPKTASKFMLCTQHWTGGVATFSSLVAIIFCAMGFGAPLLEVVGIPAALLGTEATKLGYASTEILKVIGRAQLSLAGAVSTQVAADSEYAALAASLTAAAAADVNATTLSSVDFRSSTSSATETLEVDLGDGLGAEIVFGCFEYIFILFVPIAAHVAILWMQLYPRDHVSYASLRVAAFLSTFSLMEVLLVACLIYACTISIHLVVVEWMGALYYIIVYCVATPVAFYFAIQSKQHAPAPAVAAAAEKLVSS